jgi:hypothetical protein
MYPPVILKGIFAAGNLLLSNDYQTKYSEETGSPSVKSLLILFGQKKKEG